MQRGGRNSKSDFMNNHTRKSRTLAALLWLLSLVVGVGMKF
jgi:hypothetical protein